jgi:sporulation protein YlmC with PRC-barrel domain
MTDELPGKLEGKMAVEISGKLLGTIEEVEPQLKEGKIIFKVTISQAGDFLRKSSYVGRKVKYLGPKDILSVGKDCVIISYGMVPPLGEIVELMDVSEKHETLRGDVEALRKDFYEKVEENRRLTQDLELAREKASKVARIEEEYETLKETVIEQEGKLKIARDYVGVMEQLENMIRDLRDDIKGMEDIERAVRNIVNEELDARGLRKSY